MIEISPGVFYLLLVLSPALLATCVCMRRTGSAVAASGGSADYCPTRAAAEEITYFSGKGASVKPERKEACTEQAPTAVQSARS